MISMPYIRKILHDSDGWFLISESHSRGYSCMPAVKWWSDGKV